MTLFRPADVQGLRDCVAAAAEAAQPLEILGGGSKRELGRPLQVAHTLDLSAFSGIVSYEPSELVMTARAATPLAEIMAALAGQNQMLAFEPPDLGAVLGNSGGQTIGGVISCNLAGPRRFKAGAARDHFLGFAGISGRGESFKAGGKVVKNVTGYDLCKLMAGAYGTLVVLSEVTVKVLPRPEKTRTVLVFGLDDRQAVAAMSEALNAPHEVSGAAHLPASLGRRSAISYVAAAGSAVTALRLEGPGASVSHRCAALRGELAGFGATEELHSVNSARLWQEIGDAAPLAGDREGRVVWRLSLPPTTTPALIEALARRGDVSYFLDWGGGLVWLALADSEDGGAAAIRAALGSSGGHATLISGSAALRSAVPVFEPQSAALAALAARIKESFDPRRILNPGRMYREL